MISPDSTTRARAEAQWSDDALIIRTSGVWRLRQSRPTADEVWPEHDPAAAQRIVVSAEALEDWDSSLLLFVMEVRARAAARDLAFETRDFPAAINEWMQRLDRTDDDGPEKDAPPDDEFPITRQVGVWTTAHLIRGHGMLAFLGDALLGFVRTATQPGRMRWGDCLEQMRRCGAQALGIVGLITFLVGVILAFVASTQLQQFGADIFVANLVGLAVFREMGPMMAAIVLTGRTGAAYAAELGNMRLNEEIDALETFGVRAYDFLVMPRMIALVVMMPLLALYADFLGVVGGVVIAQLVLDVPPVAFYAQLRGAIGLNDIATGLLKSCFFGAIVAYSGCLKGMNAHRSAVGVGEATTAAVVLGILLIIISDAGFTVIFNTLGW